jgi:hypothetical protein
VTKKILLKKIKTFIFYYILFQAERILKQIASSQRNNFVSIIKQDSNFPIDVHYKIKVKQIDPWVYSRSEAQLISSMPKRQL